MMPGISVNLLPKDVILQRRQNSKLSIVNRLSVGLLITLVFFTSATLAVRIMQRTQLQNVQQGLVYAQEKVQNLSGKEEQVIILKNRLDAIGSLMGGDSKRKEVFNTVIHLTPLDLQVIEVLVDKNGIMTISFSGSSLPSIKELLANLSNKENGLDPAKINLEGLSLGKDSVYRFTLKIIPK